MNRKLDFGVQDENSEDSHVLSKEVKNLIENSEFKQSEPLIASTRGNRKSARNSNRIEFSPEWPEQDTKSEADADHRKSNFK